MARRFKAKGYLTLLSLFSLIWFVSIPTQAHLLNMTRITLQQGPNQNIAMTVVIDLTRATGGGENYFQLAQSASPILQQPILDIAQRIQAASLITINGQGLRLNLVSVNLPQSLPKEDFTSSLAWPMSTFVFNAAIPVDLTPIETAIVKATFTSQFEFEEPIALSIQQTAQKRSLNRWLVRNQQSPSFDLYAPTTSLEESTPNVWSEYIWQGIIHILPKGWDHALFVLGLFLGARRIRDLLLWVTGFTLGHTVTLGLAAYGAIEVSPVIIEPIIALSIAWIAIENISQPATNNVQTSTWWRLGVVVIFGLMHGLGFALALKELGFPAQGFMSALISFNIGVELAQLTIIAIAFMVLGHWYKNKHWRARVVVPGSAIIACIAISLMVLHIY